MYQYQGMVDRVVDGDTVDILIDLGFHVTIHQRVRVNGINAPEKNTDPGKAAVAAATALLPSGTVVTVNTYKDRQEKFGRFLAAIRLPDGRDYATTLIEQGHAVPWDGKGQRP